MRKEGLLHANPRRLWIALVPVLALCAGGAVAHEAFAVPAFPFVIGCIALAFLEGVLVARSLPSQIALETRALQVEAVCNLIKKAGASLELQEVLDSITSLTVKASGVRGCSIKLLDAGGRQMSVRSIAGLQRRVADLSAEAAESIANRSLMDGRPVLVEGAAQDDFPELDGETESLICVPLRHEARVIGALCVYGKKGTKLSPEMLSFLSRLGDLAVLSIQNAEVYEALKRVNEAKGWFLRKAAHELASPLSVIQSVAQNLLAGYLGDLDASQRASIERIRVRAAGLSDVVADLLALARGKAGKPAEGAAAVDLAAAVREIAEFYQPSAALRGVSLVTEASAAACPVALSAEAARSVLANLVSNAIKYSPTGSAVSVRLEASDSAADLSVSDQGIGIPEAEKERLFSEFFRASNARSFTEEGTGLGLAIVKSVVDAAGGSLAVQSVEGKGTTVTVRLPRAR